MFEQIEFSQVKENVVDLIARQWALVTAGDEKACNTMTVSWGAVGELWGVDTATVYIRPQRYTDQFISTMLWTRHGSPQGLKMPSLRI